MKELHETVVQTASLQAIVQTATLQEPPISNTAEGEPLLLPPGITGDLLGEQDPWVYWKGTGGGKGKAVCAQDGQADINRLVAKAVEEAVSAAGYNNQQTEFRKSTDSKFRKLDERNFRRVTNFAGKIEDWAECFVCKTASRGLPQWFPDARVAGAPGTRDQTGAALPDLRLCA